MAKKKQPEQKQPPGLGGGKAVGVGDAGYQPDIRGKTKPDEIKEATKDALRVGEAEADGALETLVDQHGDTLGEVVPENRDDWEAQRGTRERDENGRFKSKKDDARVLDEQGERELRDDPQPGAEELAEEIGDDQADEELSDEDREAYADAYAALRRDGFTKDDINELGRDTALRLGKKAADRQKDIDAKFDERSRERNQTPTQPTETPTDRASQEGADQQADPFAEVATHFESFYGDTVAGDLIRGPYQALEQRQVNLEGRINDVLDVVSRDQMAEEFPKVKNAGLWKQVKNLATKLGALDEGASRADLLQEAAEITLGPEQYREQKAKTTKKRAAQDKGSRAPSTHRSTSADRQAVKDMDAEQLQDYSLDLRMAGRVREAEEVEARAAMLNG